MIKNKKLLRSEFLINVFTIMTGTTIAQTILVLFTPILTRLYTPSDFGNYSIYISIISIIGVIVTLRYEMAIMLPKKNEDAINIVALSIISSVIISFLLMVFIISFKQIFIISSIARLSWVVYIPITIFFIGFNNSLNYWLNRSKEYKTLAKRQITQSLSTIILSLIMGYYGLGLAGLILGNIFGLFFVSLLLSFNFWKNHKDNIKYISVNSIKKQAYIYSDFPIKSTFGSFLNTLSGQLPLLLMNNLYSSSIVGLYSLTIRVLNTPMSLIGNAVSQVLYEKASQEHQKGELLKLFTKTTKMLFIIIMPPMILIFIFGEKIFTHIFGLEWSQAGIVAQIFVPFYLVRFLFSSQSTLLMVKRKLGFEIKFNVFFLISQIVSLIIGYLNSENYFLSFTCMSISGFLLYIYLGRSIRSFL